MVESAARERLGVPGIAVFRYLDPGNDPARLEIAHQEPNSPEFEVALEYVPYGSSFLLIDDQLSLVNVVSQRARASHPHSLALGGRDLVADALADHLTLELRERQQHVESQSSHRGCGIELLGDRNERNPLFIKQLDHFGEVGQRAGEAVDLVDYHHIDETLTDVGEQLLQRGPLHRTAGEAAIIVGRAYEPPAFASLAPDERLAGLALRVE